MADADKEKSATGLPRNTAAALTYVGAWITGIVFLLLEKDDKVVRFHAMQSIVVFGLLTIVSFVPVIGWILSPFLMIIGLVLWLVLIFKAYKGEKYKVPVLGDFAEKRLEQF